MLEHFHVSDLRRVRIPNKLCAGQMSSRREGENTEETTKR